MSKIIITQGLQASGKSTWAKEFIKKNKDWVRVNRDSIRLMLHGNQFDPKFEGLVSNNEFDSVFNAIKLGFNVIIDAMHLNEKYIRDWKNTFALYKEKEVVFEVKKFDVPVSECIFRDLRRKGGRVGAAIICQTAVRYNLIDWNLFDKYVCVDIDGTLANNNSPIEKEKLTDKEWKKHYFSRDPLDDLLNEPIYKWVCALKEDNYGIIILSGRDFSWCGKTTEDWLVRHKIPFDYLFMRKSGDHRKDFIIKNEILKSLLDSGLPKEKIVFSIDDRNQVINECWKKNGIKCYGVSETDGEY